MFNTHIYTFMSSLLKSGEPLFTSLCPPSWAQGLSNKPTSKVKEWRDRSVTWSKWLWQEEAPARGLQYCCLESKVQRTSHGSLYVILSLYFVIEERKNHHDYLFIDSDNMASNCLGWIYKVEEYILLLSMAIDHGGIVLYF